MNSYEEATITSPSSDDGWVSLQPKDNEEFYNNRYLTVVVDSCEYLAYDGNDKDMTHKGNCRYCAERRKQEIKELIDEIRK